jgi:sulfite exporter TauE/SafE
MSAWLIFLGGLLGSAHCAGMCCGFVLALGSAGRSWQANLGRQIVYALGRVFTYAVLGCAASYGAAALSFHVGPVSSHALFCLAAGGLLIIQGLRETGVRFRPAPSPLLSLSVRQPAPEPGLAATFFGELLQATRARNVFLAGMVNGLLPCGLVYGYLTLAATAEGPWRGAALMALFGLGTVPAMVLLGSGSSLLSAPRRRQVLRLAAWCIVVTGALAIWQGVRALEPRSEIESPATACPLCPECPSDPGE